MVTRLLYTFLLQAVEFSLDLAPPGQGSVLGHVLDVGAIVDQTTLGLHVLVNLTVPLGESPLLGNEDLQKTKRDKSQKQIHLGQFSRRLFEKKSVIKFHQKHRLSTGAAVSRNNWNIM